MKHANGWGENYPTPGQYKELFAQVDSGKVTSESLQRFLCGELELEKKTNWNDAIKILGDDIISPSELFEAYGIPVYHLPIQARMFERALPSKRKLNWLRDNDYMLIAGPSRSLSILDIQNILRQREFPDLKIDVDVDYFSQTSNQLGNVVSCGWYEIRKSELPGSLQRCWNDRADTRMGVPNIAEVAWAFISYKMVRKVDILGDISLMTSTDGISNRCRAHVCFSFDEEGRPLVTSVLDDYKSDKMGIAVCETDI